MSWGLSQVEIPHGWDMRDFHLTQHKNKKMTVTQLLGLKSKNKTTLFLSIFKVEGNTEVLFFWFNAYRPSYGRFESTSISCPSRDSALMPGTELSIHQAYFNRLGFQMFEIWLDPARAWVLPKKSGKSSSK